MPVVLILLAQPALGRHLGRALQQRLGVEVIVAIGEDMARTWLTSGQVAVAVAEGTAAVLALEHVQTVVIGAAVPGAAAQVSMGPRLQQELLRCVDGLLGARV